MKKKQTLQVEEKCQFRSLVAAGIAGIKNNYTILLLSFINLQVTEVRCCLNSYLFAMNITVK